MNLAWTTSEFGRTAESTHENFFASISRDALTRWFASGSSRDSPVAQEVVAVLRSELLASLEQHGPKATLALVMSSWGANPPDTLRVALMKLRITQQGSLPVAETGRVSRTRDGGEFAELYIRAQTALRSMPVKAPPFARFPQTERDEETRCA